MDEGGTRASLHSFQQGEKERKGGANCSLAGLLTTEAGLGGGCYVRQQWSMVSCRSRAAVTALTPPPPFYPLIVVGQQWDGRGAVAV